MVEVYEIFIHQVILWSSEKMFLCNASTEWKDLQLQGEWPQEMVLIVLFVGTVPLLFVGEFYSGDPAKEYIDLLT
jgi:hypothetical protein